MKAKFLSLVVSFLCSVPLFSQKMYLREVTSPYENISYTYLSNGKIDQSLSFDGEFLVKNTYLYDGKSQCIRVDCYQQREDESWLHAYYVEYTYDEQGNRATRVNYNRDLNTGEMFKNGIMTYTYDDRNLLVKELTELVREDDVTVPLSQRDFTYSREGQLLFIEVIGNNNLFGGEPEWAKESREGFAYDENGNVLIDSVMIYDGRKDDYANGSKKEYLYDTHGNLIRYNYATTTPWTLRSYDEFEYDLNKPAGDYVFPEEWESGWPYFKGINHERTKELEYTQDFNTGELVQINTYEYRYDVASGSSVEDLKISGQFIFPNPVKETFTVNLAQTTDPVSIYDLQGNLVVSFSRASGLFNVAGLIPGMYFLKCGMHTTKFIKE